MKRKIKQYIANIVGFILYILIPEVFVKQILEVKYNYLSRCFKHHLKRHGKNINIKDKNTFIGLENVEIGNDFYSQEGLWLSAYSDYYGQCFEPHIKIGNNVRLSRFCHIGAIQSIVVEDNVLIGSNVLIIDHAHGNSTQISSDRANAELVSKGGIVVGKNTWIGDNSVILSNVKIGENCIIGAGAIVTKDIPANSIAVGVPARVINSCNKDNL